jgi:Putative metallopeptidase
VRAAERTTLLRFAMIVAVVTAALGLAACGSGSSSSTGATGASGASGASGEQGAQAANISTTFAKPTTRENAIGATFLKEGGIANLAQILGSTFQIPKHITVEAVNGLDGGPHYDPSNDTITFQYGFAALIFETLKQNNPDWSNHKLGFATGSVIAFILEHEFTHALINIYNLPVLGKEEDAADALATLLLLKAPNGDKLALGAAEFWADFSGRQNPPAIADYADEHSLDLQRAYSIVCDIAGSNQQRYNEINQAGILPDGNIKSCPAQYQQDVKSFTQVLQPHVNGKLDFQAPSN